MISATRFGEISPLWKNLTRLWQYLAGLFRIWQNSGPTLANCVGLWSILIAVNGLILKKKFSHLVTLPMMKVSIFDQKITSGSEGKMFIWSSSPPPWGFFLFWFAFHLKTDSSVCLCSKLSWLACFCCFSYFQRSSRYHDRRRQQQKFREVR